MRNLVVAMCLVAGCEPTIGNEPLAPSDEDDPTYESIHAWEPDPDLDSDGPVCADGDEGCDALPELDVEMTAASSPDGTLFAAAPAKWPNGVIPYVIDDSVNASTREALSKAMTNWTTQTENRIRFRARRSSDTAYVRIVEGSPLVRPFIGYRAGAVQTMQLRDNEYVTVIKHEIGHVVGFAHEHKRLDRGSYIRVTSSNIVSSSLCEYQFSRADVDRGVPYDRVSIMHYRTTELKNCRTGPVLRRLDGGPIDHVWKLSRKDLDAVAKRYDAPGVCRAETEAQLCTKAGKECGSLTTKDSCGTSRTVDCGTCIGDEVTAWSLALEENGTVSAAGMCATVSGGSTSDGAPILSGSCKGGDAQDWRTTRNGQLKVKHSLLCATVAGASVPDASIEQRTCDASDPAQAWQLSDMEIVNGRTGECVGVSGTGLAVGACTDDAAQKFAYRSDREELVAGRLCLTAKDGAAPGHAVVLQACDGRDTQRWFQGRGGFVSRANTSQCMRVAGGALTGAAIEVNDCNDHTDQRWALRGNVRDARAGMCLHASTTPDTPLKLRACDGSGPQLWTFWSR